MDSTKLHSLFLAAKLNQFCRNNQRRYQIPVNTHCLYFRIDLKLMNNIFSDKNRNYYSANGSTKFWFFPKLVVASMRELTRSLGFGAESWTDSCNSSPSYHNLLPNNIFLETMACVEEIKSGLSHP
mgnify:CR=1 FL=1